MWRVAKRNDFPLNLRLDGGSDWLIIHRDLAEYSVSTEDLPSKLRLLFTTILLPLESFFHTLSINSKNFCNQIFNHNLRFTNWERKQGCRCSAFKPIVDWCGCSPLVVRNFQIITEEGIFELIDGIEFGIGFDVKEEIFRIYPPIVDLVS
uniref:protein xylosyltransferase n=1 Tax=Meloidogyne javanica TaxID=6303 RepID=A0A915M9F8_MELJA